jgi:hypothetical protein
MDSQVELVRIADELLEHTRTLRNEHEELRDRLAGIAPVRSQEPRERELVAHSNGQRPSGPGPQGELYPMVLQMALAGETREAALDQLRLLEYEGAEELVDEVYERVESQRPKRRRLFTRRSG